MTIAGIGNGFGVSFAPSPFMESHQGVLQYPNFIVTANGTPIQNTLIGATVTYGFDIGISTATVDFVVGPNDPSSGVVIDPLHSKDGLDYFDTIEIYMGATPGGPYQQAKRFSGLYLRAEQTMWPNVFRMVCKGNLYRAAQYYQSTIFVGNPPFLFQGLPYGSPLITQNVQDGSVINGYFNGTLGVDTTDGAIVAQILSQVPGLTIDPGNIRDSTQDGGTPTVINLSFFDAVWPPYRSAWEQVQIFDQAFLGYRTYESLGGTIFRTQVFGYPSGNSDYEYTEGKDIWEAEGTRTVEPLANSCYAEGMTQIAGTPLGGELVYAFYQESNKYQNVPVVEQFRSPFIETSDALINAGDTNLQALNANRVAEWRVHERNRILVNVQFTTFRDEPIGAGRTIAVNIPHAGVTEPVWVQRVECRIQANPVLFQQTIYGIGGGDPLAPAPPSLPASSVYP